MDVFEPYVKVNVDVSLLGNAFKQIVDRLNKLEEKVKNHENLINDKVDISEINDMRMQVSKTNGEIMQNNKDNSDKMAKFENKLNEKMAQIDKMRDEITQDIFAALKASGSIQSDGSETKPELEDINKRLSKLESNVQKSAKQTAAADSNVRELITKLTELNRPDEMRVSSNGHSSKTPISNMSPMEQLADTVSTVNHKFDTIFDTLSGSQNSGREGENGANGVDGVNGKDGGIYNFDRTVISHEASQPYRIDFGSMRPSPSLKWDINEAPNLPPLLTFSNLSEPIEYIYRLIPTLQAILIGMHDAVTEQKNNSANVVSKDVIDNMYNKLSSSFKELANEVIKISGKMDDMATTEDLQQAIAGISHQDYPETSVGVVRCMTCGREMSQVAGAMTYEEAVKTLGRAPTSIATRGGGKGLGIQYTGRGTFDSSICESPRSVRTARASTSIKVTRK